MSNARMEAGLLLRDEIEVDESSLPDRGSRVASTRRSVWHRKSRFGGIGRLIEEGEQGWRNKIGSQHMPGAYFWTSALPK